ncbi:CaiB/BaiF CoA-transferase family protein [Sulfitobacter sp. F26204]|uniref:CaiB/BaiF CoA transferase family protein n=1 Tax=Sulfitobacter sp. F26204 TaxID=2996014 RepID=UPI00225DF7D5|nr:CaiB/BaiF CoA-transferase family protein [Sulfitobacter sp. F26204]MCX7558735.1 CaiB/BaiF CoA-transferase family protein [Sulfitobacter sp. F26204]
MLNGIRIIEIEGIGPAPFSAMHLADLGADVIVVHRKGGAGLPILAENAVIDRGKRSIELDLKATDDVAVLKRLLGTADGLIEGFRPGVMEKLGLGPQDCQAVNPALVYGRMTGWGQEGPMSSMAGHDMNYIGVSGALWYASLPGQPPVAPPTLVGDIGGGAMYLTIGMLAGILNARRTGVGTVVDAAIVDGSAHMMNLLMALRQSGPQNSDRGTSLLDGPHWSRSYACADARFISVQCLEPKFYRIFLEKLGLEDDPDFAAQFDQSSWPKAIRRLVDLFALHPRDHWADVFANSDACAAPILSPDEALNHPLSKARGIWYEDDALQATSAPRFDGRMSRSGKPPARGEHTDEILALLEAEPCSKD